MMASAHDSKIDLASSTSSCFPTSRGIVAKIQRISLDNRKLKEDKGRIEERLQKVEKDLVKAETRIAILEDTLARQDKINAYKLKSLADCYRYTIQHLEIVAKMLVEDEEDPASLAKCDYKPLASVREEDYEDHVNPAEYGYEPLASPRRDAKELAAATTPVDSNFIVIDWLLSCDK